MLGILSQVAGLLSVLLLAFPAGFAARYAYVITKLKKIGPIGEGNIVREAHEAALSNLESLRDKWNWFLSACLIGGTALAGISYLLGLLSLL